MSLDLPSYEDIVNGIRADIRRFLPESDPTIFGSFLRGLADSNAGRHFDNTNSIAQLEKELFPDTATLENLTRWATYEGITPFPATQSNGSAVFSGVLSTVIPISTEFTNSIGNSYLNDSAATIVNLSISVITLIRFGTTVKATTISDHNFATNLVVTISGAVPTEYNGNQTITVLSTTTFSYQITTTPGSATGVILASCDCAKVALTSIGFGSEQNLDSGSSLKPVGTIVGLGDEGFVVFEGIVDGSDVETADNLLTRVIQSRSNPVANFNVAAITKISLSVSGVTRLKVKKITPIIGAVTVLFVRDDDDNIIPSAGEVATLKTAIETILPATSDEDDVVVTAPTAVSTNYTFSSIIPNTSTMKTAIEENLKAFYQDEVDFETDITEDKYRSAITRTIDTETGDTLTAFTLTTPTTNITVGTDEIGTPGVIAFP